jgi:hypothetical protein
MTDMKMTECNGHFLETARRIFAAFRAIGMTTNPMSQEIAQSVKPEALTFSVNFMPLPEEFRAINYPENE